MHARKRSIPGTAACDPIIMRGIPTVRGARVPLEVLAAPGETVPEHPMLGVIDEGYEQVEQRAMLREVITKLPEAEREILLLRFVANKTQTEIAAIVGVSQMQVSRLVARGLKRLRVSLGADEPPPKTPRS